MKQFSHSFTISQSARRGSAQKSRDSKSYTHQDCINFDEVASQKCSLRPKLSSSHRFCALLFRCRAQLHRCFSQHILYARHENKFIFEVSAAQSKEKERVMMIGWKFKIKRRATHYRHQQTKAPKWLFSHLAIFLCILFPYKTQKYANWFTR